MSCQEQPEAFLIASAAAFNDNRLSLEFIANNSVGQGDSARLEYCIQQIRLVMQSVGRRRGVYGTIEDRKNLSPF